SRERPSAGRIFYFRFRGQPIALPLEIVPRQSHAPFVLGIEASRYHSTQRKDWSLSARRMQQADTADCKQRPGFRVEERLVAPFALRKPFLFTESVTVMRRLKRVRADHRTIGARCPSFFTDAVARLELPVFAQRHGLGGQNKGLGTQRRSPRASKKRNNPIQRRQEHH